MTETNSTQISTRPEASVSLHWALFFMLFIAMDQMGTTMDQMGTTNFQMTGTKWGQRGGPNGDIELSDESIGDFDQLGLN